MISNVKERFYFDYQLNNNNNNIIIIIIRLHIYL